MIHYVAHSLLPSVHIIVGHSDAAALRIEIYRYLRIAATDDGQAESESLNNRSKAHGVFCLLATYHHTGGAVHLHAELVGTQTVDVVHRDVLRRRIGGEHFLVVHAAGVASGVYVETCSGAVECLHERRHVAQFLARGYESRALMSACRHHTVVEPEVCSPVSEHHTSGPRLGRTQRIVDEFLREEYHTVEPTVEQTAETLAPHTRRCDDRLMVPYHDRTSEQTQGTQKDNELESAVMRGIHGVEMLARGKYEPGIAQHHAPARQSEARTVPYHLNAVGRQSCRSVKEMRRKFSFLHAFAYIRYVLCVIKIYFHAFYVYAA